MKFLVTFDHSLYTVCIRPCDESAIMAYNACVASWVHEIWDRYVMHAFGPDDLRRFGVELYNHVHKYRHEHPGLFLKSAELIEVKVEWGQEEKMITIEVRKDGRMAGFVEMDPRHPDHWRWISLGTLQSNDAYPTYAEALEALFAALGWSVS